MNATVRWTPDRCEVWTSTQNGEASSMTAGGGDWPSRPRRLRLPLMSSTERGCFCSGPRPRPMRPLGSSSSSGCWALSPGRITHCPLPLAKPVLHNTSSLTMPR